MVFVYPNLVVTTIKCDEFDAPDGKKMVHFYEDKPTGSKARFLINVTHKGGNKFEAEVLTTKEQIEKEIAKFGTNCTPLFCVHGFNNEPHYVLDLVKKKIPKFKDAGGKYYPVPVLWATEGNMFWYETDQETNAPAAGQLLKEFTDCVKNDLFPRKSLMMHSMGNHVVFNGACGAGQPDVQFENIFMVAADVPFDIFHDNPNEDYNFSNGKYFKDKRLKADRFMNMLAEKNGSKVGKICILHNSGDAALNFSGGVANWEKRIGKSGTGDFKDVRDVIEKVIVNIDCSNETYSDDWWKEHGYQFEEWAVKHYTNYSL